MILQHISSFPTVKFTNKIINRLHHKVNPLKNQTQKLSKNRYFLVNSFYFSLFLRPCKADGNNRKPFYEKNNSCSESIDKKAKKKPIAFGLFPASKMLLLSNKSQSVLCVLMNCQVKH